MTFLGARNTDNRRPLFGRALLLLCLAGCGDRGGDSDGTTDTASTGSTGPSTSDTSATGDPTTTGPTSTADPSTSSGTSDSTTGGDGVCPPTEPAFLKTSISTLDPFFEGTLDWDCEVLEIKDGPEALAIGLECTVGMEKVDPAPTLTLSGQPMPGPIALKVGDAVHIHIEQLVPMWTETAIRVEAVDKTLLLAYAETTGVLNPFAGVGLAAAPSLCGTEEAFCGIVQHDATEVTIDGVSVELQSRHFAEVGNYGVWANAIRHYLEVECTDFADPWRDMSVVRLAP